MVFLLIPASNNTTKPEKTNKHYRQYSSYLIQQFDSNAFDVAAIRALANKDYQGFEYLIKCYFKEQTNVEKYNGKLIEEIAKNLDVEAIKILLNHNVLTEGRESILFNDIGKSKPYSYQGFKQRKKDVYKLLLPLKVNPQVSKLELLIQEMRDEGFKIFCRNQGIDFKNLKSLSINYMPNQSLARLENVICADPIETILTRTYSNGIKAEEVRQAYKYLYNKINKEYLDFLAMRIAQGDSIKILLDGNGHTKTHYNQLANVIKERNLCQKTIHTTRNLNT